MLAAIVAFVGVVVYAANNRGDPPVEQGAPRTTTTSTTTTTVAPGTPSTTAPPTTAAPATTTTTALVRQANETCVTVPPGDPRPPSASWSEHWHTQPQPNDGISLTFCVSDVRPRVGQVVTVRVSADDPDAKIGTGPCDVIVEWDAEANTCHSEVRPNDPERQPTPAEEHGHVELTFQHTYQTTGERHVWVDVWSGPDDGHKPHPYHSTNGGNVRLVVR